MVHPKTPDGVALAARRRAPISNKRNLHVTLRYAALLCTNSEPQHRTRSTPNNWSPGLPSQRQP
ncbi:uncharacterized protein LY79DRAFT_569766 [Colletotrichum navitas]|uniref:Uncharacterized protein n=1 Tax=Colletotrichum navitas TaxID=681940 RepID=A0AAD8PM84_9PEZI|nr:uncharacterized protein LY79DRAFT_569766 [Colletotrichum navitas]KAK1572696.1 hypothetical protein LY79DRAFT_569766 [Colletotrichum navitas]